MRISISNIAWEREQDLQVAKILQELKVDAIDIAPGKYFKPNMNPSKDEIMAVKLWWQQEGVELVGMQALLFGTSGLNVFGDESSQKQMLEHLKKVCRIASLLGIKALTFGSPKNRDPSSIKAQDINQMARNFFTKLGQIASDHNVIICLEPNPVIYSCNFLTTTMEAADFVKELNHPNILLQLDTGTLITNNEDFEKEFPIYQDSIGHIHISDTHLCPVINHEQKHCLYSSKIKESQRDKIVTIEMLTKNASDALEQIRNSINFVTRIYK